MISKKPYLTVAFLFLLMTGITGCPDGESTDPSQEPAPQSKTEPSPPENNPSTTTGPAKTEDLKDLQDQDAQDKGKNTDSKTTPDPVPPSPQPSPVAPSPQPSPVAPSPQPSPVAPSPQPSPVAPSPAPSIAMDPNTEAEVEKATSAQLRLPLSRNGKAQLIIDGIDVTKAYSAKLARLSAFVLRNFQGYVVETGRALRTDISENPQFYKYAVISFVGVVALAKLSGLLDNPTPELLALPSGLENAIACTTHSTAFTTFAQSGLAQAGMTAGSFVGACGKRVLSWFWNPQTPPAAMPALDLSVDHVNLAVDNTTVCPIATQLTPSHALLPLSSAPASVPPVAAGTAAAGTCGSTEGVSAMVVYQYNPCMMTMAAWSVSWVAVIYFIINMFPNLIIGG